MAKRVLTGEQRRQRGEQLGALADQVADLLNVDPEIIQFDLFANQLCLPVTVAQQLIEKAGA